jgi:thiol-disulfide isomerase/thioredoxin
MKSNSKKRSPRRNLLEWLLTLAACAVVLYFFAPPSWWQFGVTSVENRKSGVSFTLKTFNDNGVWNFSERRGKVLVVNYWATWCPPCRFEMPSLVNIANEYKERGVEMVGVTMDENLAEVAPFIEKFQIKYPILLPDNDPNIGTEAMALPTTLLYDKNGRLAKTYTGIVLESTLKSDIEELLKEN